MPAPEQSWVAITKGIVDRWKLAAATGLNFGEKPEGCAALAKLVGEMARIIDEEIDLRAAWKQLADYLVARDATLEERLASPGVVGEERRIQEARLAEVQAAIIKMVLFEEMEKRR